MPCYNLECYIGNVMNLFWQNKYWAIHFIDSLNLKEKMLFPHYKLRYN